MILREIKDRFLAMPWVYDTVRPILAGGIDFRLMADFCRVNPSDRVFDLGCGTAQPLEFIRCSRYLGVDLDPTALQKAARFSSKTVRFMEGDEWDDACRELQPTVVLMIGVVHHISDEIFRSIVRRLRGAVGPEPPRLVTIDVTYFRRAYLNNLLSRMDRGRNVRDPDAYERLYVGSGLQVLRSDVLFTRLRYVRYVGYHLSFRQCP